MKSLGVALTKFHWREARISLAAHRRETRGEHLQYPVGDSADNRRATNAEQRGKQPVRRVGKLIANLAKKYS
jgi:hypothetical protein